MSWRALATQLATLGPLGRLPRAPGTWGSVIGLFVGIGLSRWGSPWAMGVLGGLLVLAVVTAECAETVLRQHDPLAVVIDEVVAMAGIVVMVPHAAISWPWAAAAFALFRAFDIWKVQPARLAARLPGGWGVVADDLIAAGYVVIALSVARTLLGG